MYFGSDDGLAYCVDADTGTLLATKTAEDDGRWKFEVEKPAVAPCRVRVEVDGRVGERDVANAPSRCR